MSIRDLTLSEIEEVSGGNWAKFVKDTAKAILQSEAWSATKEGAKAAGRELGYQINSASAAAITAYYEQYYKNYENSNQDNN